MKIITYEAGPFSTNSYLLFDENEKKALIIDAPPDSFKVVLKAVKERSLQVEGLFLTHPHWDHTFDAPLFQKEGIKLYAHREGEPLFSGQVDLSSLLPPGVKPPVVEVDRWTKEGPISLSGFQVDILHTPGHSPGSLCCYIKERDICFTGDLIFYQSIGRTDLYGGDIALLTNSIREKLFTLPDKTKLYPGHGPETSVSLEKNFNPYIRADESE